jgi:hypothetical protein
MLSIRRESKLQAHRFGNWISLQRRNSEYSLAYCCFGAAHAIVLGSRRFSTTVNTRAALISNRGINISKTRAKNITIIF